MTDHTACLVTTTTFDITFVHQCLTLPVFRRKLFPKSLKIQEIFISVLLRNRYIRNKEE